MREIKFRAWDKEDKVMIDWWTILNHYNLNEFLDPAARDFDRYVIMQYTGFKDSNDVEVYEGDIVRRSVYLPGDAMVQRTGLIKYFNPDGRFVFRYEGLNFDANNRHKQEVIGNIYENPELLKEMS